MLQTSTTHPRPQRSSIACRNVELHCIKKLAWRRAIDAIQPALSSRPHTALAPIPRTAERLPAPGHNRQRPQQLAVITRAAYVAAASSAAPYLPALLTSVAWLVLAVAGAVFLIACIPLVASAAQSAARMAAILKIVEQELPETISTARLSGLEVTDCVRELSDLGSDLTGGIQATARIITASEATLSSGKAFVERAVQTQLLPAAARKEREAHELLAAQLRVRAELSHNRAVVSQAAAAARTLASRARAARVGAHIAGVALQAGRLLRAVANHAASRNLAGLAGEAAAGAQRGAPGA